MFITKEADEVYVAYTHFSPSLRHKPAIEKFLNIDYEERKRQYYLLEPDRTTLLNEIVSKYLLNKIRVIILDSLTAEHSARMLTMKLATDNADELIATN